MQDDEFENNEDLVDDITRLFESRRLPGNGTGNILADLAQSLTAHTLTDHDLKLLEFYGRIFEKMSFKILKYSPSVENMNIAAEDIFENGIQVKSQSNISFSTNFFSL